MKMPSLAPRFPAAVACVALLVACSSSSSVTRTPAGAGDAQPSSATPTAARIFAPGVISDANEQWRITFTPDGATAYFAESPGFFPVTRKATIYESRFTGGAWSEPRIASFSGVNGDIDPFITPDGRRLYFASIRPVNGVVRGDVDLWMVERTADGWSDPARLGDEVNGPGDELYPSASADGTLYFASGPSAPRAGEHYDIHRAARRGDGFAPREALGAAVNSAPAPDDANFQSAWDFNPEISADGRTLVFTSLRSGHGLGDLYVSHLRDGDWTRARNLGPAVNTAADEYHPTLSRDGRRLFFVRRVPSKGDFYVIDVGTLLADDGPDPARER